MEPWRLTIKQSGIQSLFNTMVVAVEALLPPRWNLRERRSSIRPKPWLCWWKHCCLRL